MRKALCSIALLSAAFVGARCGVFGDPLTPGLVVLSVGTSSAAEVCARWLTRRFVRPAA